MISAKTPASISKQWNRPVFLFLLLSCLFLFSCSTPEASPFLFRYDLSNPALMKNLPHKLKEISALAVRKNGEIMCVQDEKGSVYIYDLAGNSIKDSIGFGKDQDYEGISLEDSTIYILKSNGNIFEVSHPKTARQKTVEYRTFLKIENNTEGLCLDRQNGRLLVSCKGKPGYKNKTFPEQAKAIYAFDLRKKKFDTSPAFLIHPDSVAAYIHKYFPDHAKERMKVKKELFAPSEIAVSPTDGHIYVLCSVGKLLIIMDQSGRILYITPLSERNFPHPEGITFLQNGDMFISNEGAQYRPANILLFSYMGGR